MTPEQQAIVQEALQAWRAYEMDAEEFVGWPLKSAPVEFRLSRDRSQWESSWGYNVHIADTDKLQWAAVLAGDAPYATVGPYTLTPHGLDTFDLGCFTITREQAQWLLDNTP